MFMRRSNPISSISSRSQHTRDDNILMLLSVFWHPDSVLSWRVPVLFTPGVGIMVQGTPYLPPVLRSVSVTASGSLALSQLWPGYRLGREGWRGDWRCPGKFPPPSWCFSVVFTTAGPSLPSTSTSTSTRMRSWQTPPGTSAGTPPARSTRSSSWWWGRRTLLFI